MQSHVLHHCRNITVENHLPDNGNCLTLKVEQGFHEATTPTSLVFFGLPKAVTDALMAALDKSETEDAA